MTSSSSPPPHKSSHHNSITGATQGSRADDGSSRGYMQLKDIMVEAQPDIDRDAPVHLLLEKAEGYIASSKRSIDFRRLDIAYKDYLKGYDVVVNYIPLHKDYGFVCDTRKGWESRYKSLLRTIQDMEQKMEQVRLTVQNDNAKRRSQLFGESAKRQSQSYSSGFGIPSAVSSRTSSTHGPSRNIPEQLRPAVRSKPESMHGNAIEGHDLSQRFARLRMPTSEQSTSAIDEVLAYSASSSQINDASANRPIGPREMPTSSDGPSIPPKVPLPTRLPPKIPLDTSIPMPKPPSPTYSPAKVTMSNTVSFPPRSSTEYNGANSERRQMYYNQPSHGPQPLQVQRAREDNPYRPRTPNGVNSAIIAKSSSSEIPYEQAISAEVLVEYIKRYNVLLIDVRAREIFDEGHIFSKSIICIEPVALKEGVSAEELEERLVVSPESEQSLFERRNEFDIVVYHDQRTNDTRYLRGPPTSNNAPALRALYDTLYEFNNYKPLRDGRPPALLLGGIDAWVDLMSTNSLATSKTAALMGSTRSRYWKDGLRPIGRHRMVSANSNLEVRKRRLREHKPLNPDEADAWRQKAQEEEVDTNEYVQDGSDGDGVDDVEPNSPFVHDYESFLRKFPEVNGVQQSMTMPSRIHQPPQRYDYPPAPAAPSRPAPAVPRPSYSGQAEINSSQAPLARQASAMRPPLYASSSIARRLKLPRTGLTNFGVTCYMNSTLQCLSATMPLSQFFLEDQYKGFLQHNWKGSDGIMPDLYTNLIRSLWRSDVEVIKPTTFRKFCGRMNREWGIERQQDAKEFFDFLIDCLHEDLNINWQRTPLKPLTTAEEMQRERTPIDRASLIEWQRYTHRDYSFVSSLFAGQHASRLRCTTCRNTSTTYEAFYSISVEIPQTGLGNIYDCLRSYCQEEMLSGEEVWKCPHCRCEREATKQIILTRLPQFLVIHFKRFSASKTESARKIHTSIDFPLYGLNMDNYMISRSPLAITNGETKVDAAITPPFSYDAYGVLRHLGSTGNGGHYISMVRDPGRGLWRRYDDERTNDFDPSKLAARDRLTNHEAYIVFYQRQVPR